MTTSQKLPAYFMVELSQEFGKMWVWNPLDSFCIPFKNPSRLPKALPRLDKWHEVKLLCVSCSIKSSLESVCEAHAVFFPGAYQPCRNGDSIFFGTFFDVFVSLGVKIFQWYTNFWSTLIYFYCFGYVDLYCPNHLFGSFLVLMGSIKKLKSQIGLDTCFFLKSWTSHKRKRVTTVKMIEILKLALFTRWFPGFTTIILQHYFFIGYFYLQRSKEHFTLKRAMRTTWQKC